MSKIEQIEYDSTDGTVYRLVLEPTGGALTNMCHLQKGEELSNNENYSSYRARGDIPVKGMVYVDTHPDEKEVKRLSSKPEPHYVDESYEKYLQKLGNLDEINFKWIRKIISGEAEPEKILERNDDFLVARDWKFDLSHDEEGHAIFDRENLHILGIPVKQIGSLRDIELEDVPMLNKMKEKALELCREIFDVQRDEVKIYFHYPPTTYHLHIHFTWVDLSDSTVNFERAYDFDTVIRNIQLDPNYYRESMKFVKYVR
jgi:m7GpppX diphosphatase